MPGAVLQGEHGQRRSSIHAWQVGAAEHQQNQACLLKYLVQSSKVWIFEGAGKKSLPAQMSTQLQSESHRKP